MFNPNTITRFATASAMLLLGSCRSFISPAQKPSVGVGESQSVETSSDLPVVNFIYPTINLPVSQPVIVVDDLTAFGRSLSVIDRASVQPALDLEGAGCTYNAEPKDELISVWSRNHLSLSTFSYTSNCVSWLGQPSTIDIVINDEVYPLSSSRPSPEGGVIWSPGLFEVDEALLRALQNLHPHPSNRIAIRLYEDRDSSRENPNTAKSAVINSATIRVLPRIYN